MSIALWMKDEMEKMRQEEAAMLIAPDVRSAGSIGEARDCSSGSDSSPSPAPSKDHKDPESRRWVLTLPHSEYSEAEVVKRLGKYKAVVGQLEAAPTTGYLHWQLYLEAKSAVRFSTLRKLFPKGHYEVARKTRIQAVKYVTREDKRAESGEVISLGQMDLTIKQGKRTDLDSYSEQIILEGKSADEVIHDDHRAVVYAQHLGRLELIRDRKIWGNRFREVEVHYIHGATRTGKTSALFKTYGYEAIYRVSNWKNPFDGYKGQDILLLDEYNTSVPIVDMLKILEGYPLEVSARYSDKIAKFCKVFIVSNLALSKQHLTIQQEHPEQWAAFEARLSSVSEMIYGGKLVVSKGVPPQLDHYLEDRPVEIVAALESKLPSPEPAVDDDAFDEELDDLFGDDDLAT